MAEAALYAPLSRAVGWLARPPPAARFGPKLGTAMAVAIWIADASGQSWGLTIWTTVMFISQPSTGASIKKGLTRFCGTAASALVSIAIYGLFIHREGSRQGSNRKNDQNRIRWRSQQSCDARPIQPPFEALAFGAFPDFIYHRRKTDGGP